MLILIMTATSVNYLVHIIVEPFMPDMGIYLVAEPAWFCVAGALIAAVSPFVYRLVKILLRRAFLELSEKYILFLCISPMLFYIFVNVFTIETGIFTNLIF